MKKLLLVLLFLGLSHQVFAATPTSTNTPTVTATPFFTATWTPTFTGTPTVTPIPVTPTFTPTPVTAVGNNNIITSADILSPVSVNLNSNVQTFDMTTEFSAAPGGAAPATIFVYKEPVASATLKTSGVTQTIAANVVSGNIVQTGVAAKAFYIVPAVTPTQTCVATYIIGTNKTIQ